MGLKVAILPDDESRVGGVTGVIYALKKHLREVGIEITAPDKADIVHCHAFATWPGLDVHTIHGLYPTPETATWQKQINERILENIFFAKIVTAPAIWVTKQYDYMGRATRYIPNGVDLAELKPGNHHKYVLFGKTLSEGITKDGFELAKEVVAKMPTTPFIFLEWDGPTPRNVKVVGKQSFDDMRTLVQNAAVYLATTWECHSLQVLEAMAYEVPIAGMNWGGTAETVGGGGVLVNDKSGLPEAIQYCFANAKRLGRIGREIVTAEFQWADIIPRYVDVYEEALQLKSATNPVKASIVITCHNLEKYINEAIDSALNQKFDSFEVIVIDDGSTDDSWRNIGRYKGRIKAFRRTNGLHSASYARNDGIERARGEYVVCLDGDDKLHEDYLAKLCSVLDSNPWLGVAYSAWNLFGTNEGTIWPQPWNFEALKNANYIGCASLFRKEAWRRVGGYKNINPSWEDYDFWLSLGEARWFGQMYPEPLWDYRVRDKEGRNYESRNDVPRLRETVNAHHPRLYNPTVSVIIPCYKHEQYVAEAVQSVVDQTFYDWEAIVVDDGTPDHDAVLLALMKFENEPRVKYIRQDNMGLAAARNAGIDAARGTYILPLDADDKLDPQFLERTLKEMVRGPGIIYTDFIAFSDQGVQTKHELPDYSFEKMLNERGMMFCSSLYPKQMWVEVGGYPEDMKLGWEDYAFWIAAGVRGWYGRRIADYYGFYYRQHGKTMRVEAWEQREIIRKQLFTKFGILYETTKSAYVMQA
jgi:glycosyltransferase involved in cell wall biosynthesis